MEEKILELLIERDGRNLSCNMIEETGNWRQNQGNRREWGNEIPKWRRWIGCWVRERWGWKWNEEWELVDRWMNRIRFLKWNFLSSLPPHHPNFMPYTLHMRFPVLDHVENSCLFDLTWSQPSWSVGTTKLQKLFPLQFYLTCNVIVQLIRQEMMKSIEPF